jgi:hypothetical protein
VSDAGAGATSQDFGLGSREPIAGCREQAVGGEFIRLEKVMDEVWRLPGEEHHQTERHEQ